MGPGCRCPHKVLRYLYFSPSFPLVVHHNIALINVFKDLFHLFFMCVCVCVPIREHKIPLMLELQVVVNCPEMGKGS